MNKQQVNALAELLSRARRPVFFGGAGVSTQSGIPDFRSSQGLYAGGHHIPPERIISRSYFDRYPESFFAFYREKLVYPKAKPGDAHLALAWLEEAGLLSAVITQNIDGLHQAAGSKRVLELHGSVHRNLCLRCSRQFPLDEILGQTGIPHCPCGGILKPDVVLYEEALDPQIIGEAAEEVRRADLMIAGGTSLRVYPAASFVEAFHGKLVLINKSATPMDGAAELLINESIGETLKSACELLKTRQFSDSRLHPSCPL